MPQQPNRLAIQAHHFLAQLQAPLVERVQPPDHTFGKHAVFMKCDQAVQASFKTLQ